jgi:uncharacterized protein YdaU (DUF1376 family)
VADYPALPLWTDAYLGDTTHLTEAEHGRYLLLLIHLWRAPRQRFPNDDAWLARKFGRDVEWVKTALRPLIAEFCKTDGNWIKQLRLSREFKYVAARSEKQSARAKLRWQKEKRPSRGNAEPHRSGTTPTPTPTPTKNKFVTATPSAKKPGVSAKAARARKPRPASSKEPAPSADAPVAGHTMDDNSFRQWVELIEPTLKRVRGWAPAQALARWRQTLPSSPEAMAEAWRASLAADDEASKNSRFAKRPRFPENWLKDRVYEPFLAEAEQRRHDAENRAKRDAETIRAWNGSAEPVIAVLGNVEFHALFNGSSFTVDDKHVTITAASRFHERRIGDNPTVMRVLRQHFEREVIVVSPKAPAQKPPTPERKTDAR